MAISIKNKIRLGTIFLFSLLILSGGLSVYYLVNLEKHAKNIIKDNYESLSYCHSMQRQLDSIQLHYSSAITRFDSLLTKQENNITERGEKETTAAIRILFNKIVQGDTITTNYNNIRQHIQTLLTLNMQAIARKNKLTEESSEQAYTIIILIAALIFIVGLTFSFNFPTVVTTPIQSLMDAIKEVSKKNYRYRIHLNRKDEFGELANAFNLMSERLEAFENSNLNKLIFEKARAEAVINSLKDASIGIDKNDTVLFANQQALRLLGLKKEEIIGKAIKELSSKNDLFKFLTTNENTTPFKIIVEGKENFYTKELIEVQQGEATNKVIVLKNITSFKELDVAKTNFIATVSHELKTPLASSDFSLKLLEDTRIGQLTDEQKELVQQLKNDNQRMLRILSELLNMSQVEAGKIQLDIQSISPYQIVEDSIKAITATAKENKIRIEQKIENDLPNIKADVDKVSWILNNFLTNAIKFSTEESRVVVSVEKKDNYIVFSVSDPGPGIEEIYHNRIFERYFQIPGRVDKKGSGIGLAICKEFVEAMGGNIWVQSELGQGSVFGFSLPGAI